MMAMPTLVAPGAVRDHLVHVGWIDEELVAAGHLRQGKPPTMLGMLTGHALIEVVRPRRSKLLPRHFVLAVTPTRVLAFKAWAGGGEGADDYAIGIRPGVRAEFAREDVGLEDLADGPRSKGGTLRVGADRLPVGRPYLNGDADTDALFALLGGVAPVVVGRVAYPTVNV
jgi:hypothetical protein